MLVEVDVVLGRVIRGVQVVRVRGILGGEGVDALYEGRDAEGLALGADGVFLGRDELGDVGVGEALAFSPLHELSIDVFERTCFLESIDRLDDVVDLVQEPLMNGHR